MAPKFRARFPGQPLEERPGVVQLVGHYADCGPTSLEEKVIDAIETEIGQIARPKNVWMCRAGP